MFPGKAVKASASDSRAQSGDRPAAWWLARAFWLLMIALHVRGILSAGHLFAVDRDILALIRFVAMTAATVFFSLKVIDLACLRLRPGWRSPVTLVLIVLLMHVGVIDRAIGEQWTVLCGRPVAACFLAAVLPPTLVAGLGAVNRLWVRLAALLAAMRPVRLSVRWAGRPVLSPVPVACARLRVLAPRPPPFVS